MKNLNMFCITLDPNHYKFIKKLGYIPVGLGEKKFDEGWLSDKSGINISKFLSLDNFDQSSSKSMPCNSNILKLHLVSNISKFDILFVSSILMG